MSTSPTNGGGSKAPAPRPTNPRSGQSAFPQPLQVVRRTPTVSGDLRAGAAAQEAASNSNNAGTYSTQYSNNFNRTADSSFSTGRRQTTASSRYGGFDPADYGTPPTPPPVGGTNRQRTRREEDEEEWEREQREQRRKNSSSGGSNGNRDEEEFDEEVPRQDMPRSRREMPRQPEPPRGRPGGPRRQGSTATRDNGGTSYRSNNNGNTGAGNGDEDRDRDSRRERVHINIDANGTTWTSWGDDGRQRSGQFSFAGTAFGGSPFGGGGRQNSRLGPVNLPVNLPINIPGFGGFGF